MFNAFLLVQDVLESQNLDRILSLSRGEVMLGELSWGSKSWGQGMWFEGCCGWAWDQALPSLPENAGSTEQVTCPCEFLFHKWHSLHPLRSLQYDSLMSMGGWQPQLSFQGCQT